MTRSANDLAARKEFLIAQSELSRIQIALACQEIRSSASLSNLASHLFSRVGGLGGVAAFVAGIAAPIFRRRGIGRLLRIGSIALGIFRALRSFRARR